jgi:hypothetical protein
MASSPTPTVPFAEARARFASQHNSSSGLASRKMSPFDPKVKERIGATRQSWELRAMLPLHATTPGGQAALLRRAAGDDVCVSGRFRTPDSIGASDMPLGGACLVARSQVNVEDVACGVWRRRG